MYGALEINRFKKRYGYRTVLISFRIDLPAMLISLLVFILIGSCALLSGSRTVNRQQEAIDSLRADYRHKFDRVLARFHPADTSASSKRDSVYAGMAVMVNYWLPQTAVNPPSAVAFMATRQRDVYPYLFRCAARWTTWMLPTRSWPTL